MKDVHAKVANWSKLYSIQKEYEHLLHKTNSAQGEGRAHAAHIEAEMKALLVKVDAAFKEASDAVHAKHKNKDHPSAT